MDINIKRLHVASDKRRFSLLESLIDKGESYASKLGKDLTLERKTISFHLKQLEEVGLIEGKHVITKDVKPILIKNYRVTPKGRQTYDHIMSFK